jgi:hypothetical protein
MEVEETGRDREDGGGGAERELSVVDGPLLSFAGLLPESPVLNLFSKAIS